MNKLKSIEDLRSWRSQQRAASFVPTMGSLHQGHMALVEAAKLSGESVLVSIFLNPTQFNNANDLKTYPVQLEQDLEILERAGVDAVFLPSKESMYTDNYQIRANDHSEDSQVLCARSRPGHFEGVLTIVLKLVMLAQAQKIFMGEKDFQQLTLVRKMLSSFFVEAEVIAVPTVRDEHGLALSSRNQRLSPESIKLAQRFASILQESVLQKKSMPELRVSLEQVNGLEIDYLEERWERRFAAVVIEGVRLIDNVPLRFEGELL